MFFKTIEDILLKTVKNFLNCFLNFLVLKLLLLLKLPSKASKTSKTSKRFHPLNLLFFLIALLIFRNFKMSKTSISASMHLSVPRTCFIYKLYRGLEIQSWISFWIEILLDYYKVVISKDNILC